MFICCESFRIHFSASIHCACCWTGLCWQATVAAFARLVASLPALRRFSAPWRACSTEPEHQVFPSIAGIRRNHVRGGRRNGIKRGTAGKMLSKSDCFACFANVSNFGADGRAPSGKLISHELTCFSSPNPYKRCYRQGCLLQIVGCLNTRK